VLKMIWRTRVSEFCPDATATVETARRRTVADPRIFIAEILELGMLSHNVTDVPEFPGYAPTPEIF
jgi:hypothetical protein